MVERKRRKGEEFNGIEVCVWIAIFCFFRKKETRDKHHIERETN